MRTVAYNLYTSATATAVSLGAVNAIRPGRIRGVVVGVNGVGGAGTGYYILHAMFQAATENPGQLGNTPRESNLGFAAGTMPNANVFSVGSGFIPCNIPVRIGDTFSLALTVTGTAPTSASGKAIFIVEED